MRIRYLLLHAYGMGGTVRTVIDQANTMAEFGHDVEIVSVVRRRDDPPFRIDPRVALTTLVDQRDGVRPDSLGRRVWQRMRGRIVPQGEFAAGYFTERVEKAVVDYVSSLHDGILVTTRPALNLVAARRAPASVVRVAQDHMSLAAYPGPVRQEIARYYDRFDAITVLTRANQREYRRLLPGVRIVRIPNAVEVADGEPSRQVNPVVIAAGRLVPQKGFDLLIQAFAQVIGRHPEWRLRIFGSGPRRDRLRALIDEYGLGKQVTLRGRTHRLHEELAAASVFALSSRFEGQPMVMIEAMTHALPIVAFDCPTGPGDVLTHEVDGLLLPPQDVDALAAALDRLMSDRDLRVRLGEAAAVTAKRYGRDAVMPLWEKLFTELSAAKASGGRIR